MKERGFAYLGYARRGNMGDELLFDIFSKHLAPRQLYLYPRTPRELVSYMGSLRPPRRPTLLLGGGTFIGGPWWRSHIERSALLVQPAHVVMVGAGAMGSLAGQPGGESTAREIARWMSVLGRCDQVTVRGQLTQQLLADAGIDSRVVGDPALLADFRRTLTVPQLLGITLGPTSGFGSTVAEAIIAQIVDAVVTLEAHTACWRVRVVGANFEDVEVSAQLVERLRAGAIEVEVTMAPDPQAFADLIAPCDVFVGQRLHSVVVASVLGIPALMLSYALKCDDFMASINRQRWTLPIDRLDAAAMSAMLVDLHVERAHHVAQLEDETARLRIELLAAFDAARAS